MSRTLSVRKIQVIDPAADEHGPDQEHAGLEGGHRERPPLVLAGRTHGARHPDAQSGGQAVKDGCDQQHGLEAVLRRQQTAQRRTDDARHLVDGIGEPVHFAAVGFARVLGDERPEAGSHQGVGDLADRERHEHPLPGGGEQHQAKADDTPDAADGDGAQPADVV